MNWADKLPRMRADREAWQAKHGPALRARDAEQAARRARVADLVRRGLEAIKATPAERAEVAALTGLSVEATQ